jgi:hypothetical protein
MNGHASRLALIPERATYGAKPVMQSISQIMAKPR